MRAFNVSIPVCALAGAAISVILLYQHNAADMEFGMYAFGSELVNSLRILAQSGFDTVPGFSIAGPGMMACLFIIAIASTMIYGESRYHLCRAAFLEAVNIKRTKRVGNKGR